MPTYTEADISAAFEALKLPREALDGLLQSARSVLAVSNPHGVNLKLNDPRAFAEERLTDFARRGAAGKYAWKENIPTLFEVASRGEVFSGGASNRIADCIEDNKRDGALTRDTLVWPLPRQAVNKILHYHNVGPAIAWELALFSEAYGLTLGFSNRPDESRPAQGWPAAAKALVDAGILQPGADMIIAKERDIGPLVRKLLWALTA